MLITVEPLSDAIGAEAGGIGPSRPVARQTRRAIHRAFLDHSALLFRGQRLSEANQEDFCRLFGALALVKSSRSKNAGQPHIMFVSNVRNEGFQTTLEDGEMWFHSDQCYYESPAMATTLYAIEAYAIEAPPIGGDTLFASAYAAYDALPGTLRARSEGWRAGDLSLWDNCCALHARTDFDPRRRRDIPGRRPHGRVGDESLCESGRCREDAGNPGTAESLYESGLGRAVNRP